MFVQHVVAVLTPSGLGATVMPHGALFRGGEEHRIREGLLRDDVIEVVIGLGPNLFYGTSIPLNPEQQCDLVITILDEDLANLLNARISTQRHAMMARFRIWSDKYAISLDQLEADRKATCS